MEQPISNQSTNQSPEQITDQALHEKSPSIRTDSKVLRPLRRALGIAALATAALGPGKAEAMDNNTKNILWGVGAAVLNQQTGVVLRPSQNGPTIDIDATMRNRQIMEQQRIQREQAAAIRQRIMQAPTAESQDVTMSNFFKSKGIKFKEGELNGKKGWFLYEPLSPGADNNQENGFFFSTTGTNGNPVKYTSVHFSYKGGNVFTATAAHTDMVTLQSGGGSVDIEYNPLHKSFHPASKR